MVAHGKLGCTPDAGMDFCEMTGKSMCSKGQAKSLAKRLSRQRGANINAFCCRYCGRWHVGGRRW